MTFSIQYLENKNYLKDIKRNNLRMVKRKGFGIILVVIIAVILFMGIFYFINQNSPKSQDIRLGYMTSWAEGSFPVEALREGGIAEKNNLNITYDKFQYGPPLIEAAITGREDVLFTGWVPAITLMSKSDDWIIVSRFTYFPSALMARNGSNIFTVEELRGKKIGVPFGSGLHPLVFMSLEDRNLIPGKDVEVINLKPADMGIALKTAQVDAVAWAEPSVTLFQQQNLAYSIEDYNDIGFVVFSKSFAQTHPDEVKKFLKAFKESQFYVSQNKEQVFQWFSQESQYDISLVPALKYTEPNFNAKSLSDIDLSINSTWIEATQKKIDFEYENNIIVKRVNLSDKIDLSYLP